MLIRLLGEAQSFRVRVRAALALAHTRDERALGALESALLDSHAAVRTAAASTLGQIGTHRSVRALRDAARDGSSSVTEAAKSALRSIAAREALARALASDPSRSAEPVAGSAPTSPTSRAALARSLGHVRYAVVLGEMRDQSDLRDRDLAQFLGERIGEELRKLESVAVFTLTDMTEGVAQELARHKVPSFRLEGVSRLSGGRQLRCEVSLLLMDEPERTLRGLLKGAATSSEPQPGVSNAQQAQKTLKSAVHGALANAALAIETAAIRRDLGMNDIRAEASLREASPRKVRP